MRRNADPVVWLAVEMISSSLKNPAERFEVEFIAKLVSERDK